MPLNIIQRILNLQRMGYRTSKSLSFFAILVLVAAGKPLQHCILFIIFVFSINQYPRYTTFTHFEHQLFASEPVIIKLYSLRSLL